MDYRNVEPQILRDWFLRFAENECKEVSPLYYKLSLEIAKDDDLITLASHCSEKQPMPNLFFAAVHYLLLSRRDQELASYYPSISKEAKSDLPFSLFKAFCMKHQSEIIEIEQNKIVQTNALNRCTYLMPIFSQLAAGQEITAIDIGTSAGLTLNMDQYEYHYNDEHYFGESAVQIKSEIREGKLPQHESPVKFRQKIGIDQNPLDLKKSENANWLKALVWADMTERISKIENAVAISRKQDIVFEKAEKLSEFELIINSVDTNYPLVVYHTHALYQFSKDERAGFWDLMDRIGAERDFHYVAAEWATVFRTKYEQETVLVELNRYQNGKKQTRIMAETNGHGNWIKWC